MRRFIQILIVLIILGITGYVAYTLFMKWHTEQVETARIQVQDELKEVEKPGIPADRLIEVFGKAPEAIPGEETQISLEEVESQVMAFFSYLDSREYVSAYQLEGGAFQQFQLTIKELSSHAPLIVGETESLYSLYSNMAHFFRVLGIKRINLIKEILENESDIIESMMETFYLWFTINVPSGEKEVNRPSLEMLYTYSGYFLNTLSGRSYLLRRHAKVRTLTTYYCVLILDKANDVLLNAYGLDIRPRIALLLPEINSQTGLMNREQYVADLEKLDEKYKM